MGKISVKTTRCLALAGLLIVFIIDYITPIIFSVDILYLCCILLVVRESTITIVCFTIAVCLLIIVPGLLFGLNLQLNSSYWINKGLSELVILITAYMTIRYHKLKEAGLLEAQLHVKKLEEILLITSHRVRKPVANILGLIEIINDDQDALSTDDLKMQLNYLLSSAQEMDLLIKELNSFVEHSDQENLILYNIQPLSKVFTRPQSSVLPDVAKIVA